MTFWIHFEWNVFTAPYNLEDDGDTIKLNETSKHFWKSMPERARGMATTIEVLQEFK